jgi:1,4-alpha-glucan branching enzyme
MPDGSWQVTCELEARADETFWWGVRDRGEWMLFGQPAVAFQPADPQQRQQAFSLGNRHRLGLNPLAKDGWTVGVWAPHAGAVELLLNPDSDRPEAVTLEEQQDGMWTARSETGWAAMVGRPYAFRIVTSEGQTVLRSDPYARRRQGPQKGLSDLFVTGEGQPTHRYAQEPRGHHLLRFEAMPSAELDRPPVLRFAKNGQSLDHKALKGLLLAAAPLPELEAWWADQVRSDGAIPLVRRPDVEAYAICAGPAKAFDGLTYTIVDERGQTYHDSWSQRLDGHHNWSRFGIVSPPVMGARKTKKASQPMGDLVIYELHIGSLLGQGGNLRTSTFGQVAQKLESIKKLGFTAIALMPTNPSEGHRDWGYLGTSSMAHQEAYADPGSSAEESLLAFIKTAHGLGLSVFTDVVYNHIGGNHNDLWNFDGYKNPWFEWVNNAELAPGVVGGDLPERPNATANALPQTADPTVKNTPWGPIPAYNKRPVYQFFVDHAMDCVARLGFDGIRFDFTHLMHAQPEGGGNHGWTVLQEINRRLKHFFPDVLTFAEEFPQHAIITTPVSEGGAGFDAMWNTEHQHRLVYSHHHLSVTQAAVIGQPLPLRSFLEHLLHPAGFSRPSCSVTVLSNHDEVGNAIQIASLVAPHPRGGDLARLVCWLSLLSPGYPIMFQGTEDMAVNPFTWGVPSSWDGDSHLLGNDLSLSRRQHLQSIADVLAFRQQRRDLHSEVPISNHFLDSRSQVVAFRRAGVWVVANFGDKPYALPAEIRIESTELLSSENQAYGYAKRRTSGRKVGSLALKVFASEP